MDYLADRILGVLLMPLLPQQRICWLYLATSLLIALGAYVAATNRAGAFSLKSFIRDCLPRSVYLHRSARVDYLYLIVYRIIFVILWAPGLAAVGILTSRGTGNVLTSVLGTPEPLLSNMFVASIAFTVISVLAIDFVLYVAHYLQHKVPILWEFHKVHHSAEVLTPVTAYRMHPVDDFQTLILGSAVGGALQGLFTFVAPGEVSEITIAGLNVVVFAFYFLGYNLRHSHVWVSYGPTLSRILVSPAQHQIHHSMAAAHINKNFGFIFAFWDALFGTLYVPRAKEKLEYGLSKEENQEYASITRLFFLPFRKAMRHPVGMAVAILIGVILIEFAYSSLVLTRSFLASRAEASAAPRAAVGPVIPNSGPVMLEDLTWPEVRDLIAGGHNVAIVPSGGTEQNGPHMVLGKHNYIVRYTSEQIARRLGIALVAPVIAYVPEGSAELATGHMHFAGTLTLPDRVFEQVLESAARSLKAHGFRTICFVGDHGNNLEGQERVARQLNREWAGSGVRVLNVSDYYSSNGQLEYLASQGESTESIGTHAAIRDTSELLAINPSGIRSKLMAGAPLADSDGVRGDPSHASSERGRAMLALKINAAVGQIKTFVNNPPPAAKSLPGALVNF